MIRQILEVRAAYRRAAKANMAAVRKYNTGRERLVGIGFCKPARMLVPRSVQCVCCGAIQVTPCARAGRIGMVLPEDLRSELLTSFGRGELTNYHRHLLRAVEIWRQRGVWRVRSDDG